MRYEYSIYDETGANFVDHVFEVRCKVFVSSMSTTVDFQSMTFLRIQFRGELNKAANQAFRANDFLVRYLSQTRDIAPSTSYSCSEFDAKCKIIVDLVRKDAEDDEHGSLKSP